MPPVEDHPIHELTVQKPGAKYGCHNRKPYASGYFAPNRVYNEDGTYFTVLKRIPFVMTKHCHNKPDVEEPMCEGCTWKP